MFLGSNTLKLQANAALYAPICRQFGGKP